MFPYLLHDNFEWNKVETKIDEAKKKELLKIFPKDHFINTHRPDFWDMDSLYALGIHLFDFNDDKKLDIVYNGYFPAEGYVIEMYQNTGSGYKLILTEYQRFLDIEFENRKLKRLVITNPGCCADPIIRNKVIDVTHDKNVLTFQTSTSIEILRGTIFPDKIKDPIEFETINETYFLRSSPEIKNEPFDEYLEMNGNQIGTLRRGTKGRMIGEETDTTGRIWWFVEIYSDYKIINNVFYTDEYYSNDGANRVGWISSRYVKQL